MGTTYRSAEYERAVPYSVLSKGARNRIEENAAKRGPIEWDYKDMFIKPFKDEKAKTADELVKAYPFIDELADEMVNARLGLYNKAPTYDKSEGWIENLEDIQQPYPQEFTVVNGEPVLTPFGELMAQQDMAKSFAESKDVQKWIDHPTKQKITFTRGKRGDKSQHWYRTMDEYSDALLNDIGSEYSRALQWLLQKKLNERIKADLESPEPQYINALKNKLLPDFDYSKGNPTYEDYDKYQTGENRNAFGRMEFERPSALKTIPASFVAPMYSATHFDPELNYNTSNLEAGARLGSDIAMNAIAFGAPVAGAKLGGAFISRKVPYFRNAFGRAGAMAGGALGGAVTYGAERGADEALKFFTGKGYHQYPVDVRDIGLQALLGGAAGLPWRKGVPRYGELRQKIDPNFTSTVTNTDVKDMIGAQKEAQKLIKQGRGKVGKDAIETQYQDMAWRDYRNKFGEDEAVNFQHPPVVKDNEGIPLVQNAPAGKVMQVRDPKGKPVRRGTMENADLLVERDPVRFTDASGKAVKVDVPVAHADADASLRKGYFEQNADYYQGMSEEAKEDLWKAAKASRERDNKFSGLFTGTDEVVPISTVRENMRLFGGRPLNEGERSLKNKGVEWLWRNKTTPGKTEGGKFVEAGEAQQEALRKAKSTAHRRYGHNMLGEKELYEEPKRSKGVDIAKGFGKAASLGNALFHNVLPYSNLVGGVQPYTYEAYPDKEKK